MKRCILACTCLVIAGMTRGASAQPLEFSDDFTTAATYDSASLLAPCYGGPPTKYTMIDLAGDVFTHNAVSGGTRFRMNADNLQNSALGGRIDFAVIGWMGLGVGCPGEPAFAASSLSFTSPTLCIYTGWQWNAFQIRRGDGPGGIFGDDLAPGFAGVDDDGDGTTDGTIGVPGVDDNGNGIIDEALDAADFDEYASGGPDGGPGVAGVDDDGINGTDDIGENGFAGTDDPDDARGDQGHFILMRIELANTTAIWSNFSPTGTGNQFSIRHIVALSESVVEHNDEMPSPNFYRAHTFYNSAYCTTGTCFGSQLWVESNVANPVETIGPAIVTDHTSPAPEHNVVALGTDASFGDFNGGGFPESITTPYENQTYLGNKSMSHTFWVISGDTSTNFPSVTSDLDGDRDVDGTDFLTFSNCFNGALNPPSIGAGCTTVAGRDADLDGDDDVDGTDFLTFSNCFNGALNRPQNFCLPSLTNGLLSCTPPNNDTCGGATPIGEGTVVGTINGTVTASQAHSCDADVPADDVDLWYEYTPSCTGTATIELNCDTTGLSLIENLAVAVYDGCGGTELACQNSNNCNGGVGEEVSLAVSSGVPIYIAVLQDFPVDPSEFRLTISCTP